MAVQSWEQVGASFESLGTHLRSHFDEVSADAAAERLAFEKSIRGLLSALDEGFAAAREAVRDPMLRNDVNGVATSVREALLATFDGVEEQVRERLSRPTRVIRPTQGRGATGSTTTRPASTATKSSAPGRAARKTSPRKPAGAKRTGG